LSPEDNTVRMILGKYGRASTIIPRNYPGYQLTAILQGFLYLGFKIVYSGVPKR
jgi:hypothetical protein